MTHYNLFLFQRDQETVRGIQVQDIQERAGERHATGQRGAPRVPGHPVPHRLRDSRAGGGEPQDGAPQDRPRAARSADAQRGAGDGQ